MAFDITSANTGAHVGIYVTIESNYLKKLLWLACRHHISELLIGMAITIIFGKTMSLNSIIFEDFKSKWDKMNVDMPWDIIDTDSDCFRVKKK